MTTSGNITVENLAAPQPGMVGKILKFSGQLDESNIDENSKNVYEVIQKNPGNLYLLFDFERLEYMNSKSIGYMTDWYGKIREGNGKIVLYRATGNIKEILDAVGVTELMKCYNSLDEAKANLFKTGN